MKYVKGISLLLVAIFLLVSILPQTVAQSDQKTTSDSDNETILDTIRLLIYKKTKGLVGVLPWAGMRLVEPQLFIAEPNVIDLEYLNTTEITIGMKDEDTGKWMLIEDIKTHPLFPTEDYTFKLEIPEGVPEETFIVSFSINNIDLDSNGEMKTKLTIRPTIPKDTLLPETITLRVNVSKYTTGGFLYLPATPLKNPQMSWVMWLLSAPLWFISSISGPNPFGKMYSGKRAYESSTIVEIMVRVKRYHLAKIVPPERADMGPDEVVSIPIDVHNLGSHLDTFNFRVTTNEGSDLIVSSPQVITLEPNEVGHTSISVASSLRVNDPGTLHTIKIEGFSIYDNDSTVFSNTVSVLTRGIYISEINVFYSVTGVVFLLVCVFIFLYLRKMKMSKIRSTSDGSKETPKEEGKEEKHSLITGFKNKFKKSEKEEPAEKPKDSSEKKERKTPKKPKKSKKSSK